MLSATVSCSLAIAPSQQWRDQRQVEHPDRDSARRHQNAAEIRPGQGLAEATHDHRDRGGQQNRGEDRLSFR
jgi:hypothetical protein